MTIAGAPHIHLHGVSPFEFEDDRYQIMDIFWHRRKVKKTVNMSTMNTFFFFFTPITTHIFVPNEVAVLLI
jgi:hypothetical protein